MKASIAILCSFVLISSAALSSGVSIHSSEGVVLAVDGQVGSYTVLDQLTGWKFEGEIGQSLDFVHTNRGGDRLGRYEEIAFAWRKGIQLNGRIRLYRSTRTLIFSVTSSATSVNPQIIFPHFNVLPAGLRHFSYKERVFAPPSFALEENCTPWLLFDNTLNAVIISPADNFLVSTMDSADVIAAGLRKEVSIIPANFTRRTIMVFGHGISATWKTWGDALMKLGGKTRPSNQADMGLRYLGYWTDNGATYYYNYDSALGYAGTLLEVTRRFQEEGIPIRYLQLDSWWYDKSFTGPGGETGTTKNPRLPGGKWNRYGGAMEYSADSMLFPRGLRFFRNQVGIPLITHNRWIDPSSPYHKQYKISGYAPVDPAWWTHIMKYLASSGVVCYEQDWLSEIFMHSPELGSTIQTGDAYLNLMHSAALSNKISLQYCMAFPRFFLQGARYSNLTTVRVSDDRFGRNRWDSFLYTSQLASAVGVWPWSDVFMSDETDNLLLSTLSAGMVGIGDELGKENKANILRAVRQDGVIVKPDMPIVPVDEMYREDSGGTKQPMIAWTFTDHGSLRTAYVFAYNRQDSLARCAFLPSSFGLKGEVVVYSAKSGIAERAAASQPVAFTLGGDSTSYFVVAPIGTTGIAFLGDEGKFVCNGRQRVSSLEESQGGLKATIVFAPWEDSLKIFGFSPTMPGLKAITGAIRDFRYSTLDGRFEFRVSPGSKLRRESPGGDPVRQAVIVLTRR